MDDGAEGPAVRNRLKLRVGEGETDRRIGEKASVVGRVDAELSVESTDINDASAS